MVTDHLTLHIVRWKLKLLGADLLVVGKHERAIDWAIELDSSISGFGSGTLGERFLALKELLLFLTCRMA